MARTQAFLQNRRVNTLAIIAYPQTEHISVVMDNSFDPACAGMLESVSQYLTGNPVDLVLEQRRQRSRLPFHAQLEDRRKRVPILSAPEFLAGGFEQVFQTTLSRAYAQVLNGIAAFSERVLGAGNGGTERIESLFRTAREEITSRLETVQRTLKTLQ